MINKSFFAVNQLHCNILALSSLESFLDAHSFCYSCFIFSAWHVHLLVADLWNMNLYNINLLQYHDSISEFGEQTGVKGIALPGSD